MLDDKRLNKKLICVVNTIICLDCCVITGMSYDSLSVLKHTCLTCKKKEQ